MPILPNQRQEAFCQARALGKPQDESYRLAGYKPDPSAASRLSRNVKVAARIAELQAKSVAIYEVTVESMAAQFDEDRQLAIDGENYTVAHQASISKAKLFGLMVDRGQINVSHSYASMTEEELRFELAALNAEALALKPGQQH